MFFRPRGPASWYAGLGAAVLIAACSDGPASVQSSSSLAPTSKPSQVALPFGCSPGNGSCVGVAGDPITAITARNERFQVCKIYPNGTGPAVTVQIDATSPDNPNANSADGKYHYSVTVQPNSCLLVWSNGEIIAGTNLRQPDNITVTEIVPAGYVAGTTQQMSVIASDPIINQHKLYDTTRTTLAGVTGSGLVGGYKTPGQTVIFTNYPAPPATYTIGDRVWNDANGDGNQTGESGINGVTVTLTNSSNVVVGTTTTSGDGNYSFANLLAGTYTVCTSALPAGYTQTFDLDGLGTANCATVVVSADRNDVDFGYQPPPRFTIGDRVWNDTDNDGAQDAGEAGINGATVTLTDLSNSATSTTTTAGDGNYSFGNLLAGNYMVCVTAGVPAGYSPSYDLDGVGTPHCANVSVTQSRTDVDFGYTPPRFSIGDRVWDDQNANGQQDANEPGLTGVTVTVTDASNTVVGTTTTGANGAYTVGNLLAGTYTVCVSGVPSGYNPTYDLDGINTPSCTSVTVTQSRTDVDFGYNKPAPPATGQIGDKAWIDANGNGKQDAGEPGLAGVKLTLGGAGSGTITTPASGAYLFTSLGAGSYTVSATAPSGWTFTAVNAAGTTTANDNNATPSTVVLATGTSTDLTIDFGFVPLAGAGKGCTPGYWKQSQHFDSWKWYTQTDMVDAVFGVTFRSTANNNPTGALTLLDALELNGNGGGEQLFRHGTAALLNSVYQSGVSFPYTAPQVIKMVHDAWVSGDATKIAAVHTALGNANQAGCPLN